MTEPFTLDLTVLADNIPRGKPVRFEVQLNEAEELLLCERFNFIKLENVAGKLTLGQIADGCWELKGQINAKVTQACVVSGQLVESPIVIELEERFVHTLSEQVEIDAMEIDVGLLLNGEIPVGESLCQWIGVSAPAWPRAENAPVLGEPDPDPIENHPFAKLSELKK